MSVQTHTVAGYPLAFELGLTKVYRDEVKRTGIEYRDWLVEKPAQHLFDTEWVVSGLGVMPEKAIGEDINVDKILNGPTKRHGMRFYGIALVIVWEAIRWDLYDIFDGLVRELAKTAVDRKNLVAYGFLDNAFNASANTRYRTFQEQAACSTTHTRLDGGVWSNRLANDDALSYEGIQLMIILMRKTVNERGRYILLKPEWILTSVEQQWVADTIVKSTKRPNTANNDVNLLKDDWSVHTSVYFSQPTYWFAKTRKGDPAFSVCMRIGDQPDLVRDTLPANRNKIMSSCGSWEFATFDTRGIGGSTGGAA